MTRRLAATAAALAALAVPAAASAQVDADAEVGPVRASVQLDPAQLFTGGFQLMDPISGLTCPVLGDAGCVIQALDFQFATSLKTSGGDLKRKQVGVVNVPTPLNVDADVLPDVVATLRVVNLAKFELVIERALGETAALPLKVEALVDEPLPGLLPRRHINLGYDARASRAPQKWSSVAELPLAPVGTTVIDMTTTTTSPGTEIATLAGLYNGTADNRTSPMGGRLRYAPVPGTAKLGLTLGPKMAVRAGANRPVRLDATAELVDGARRKDVTVGLAPLPSALSVSFEQPAANRRKVVYTASAPVQDVDATYVDRLNGVTGTKVVAEAHDLPTGMTVEQTSARSGTFTATGGDLGSVEAGFANGEPRLLDEDNPYAHVIEDGDLESFAGRIDGLRSATIDATNGVDVDIQLGPDARKKLHGVVKHDGKDIDATISDLPRHIDFAFVPATGAIDYDAFGETIQKITAKATSDEPFVDRATRIEGEITGLPPKANIKATPGATGFSLLTDQPIGHADVLLSSGPDGGLAGDEVGADVVDTAEAFVAHARVNDLRYVGVDLVKDAVTGAIKKVTAGLKLKSEPTTVRYDGADLDIDADLSAIPDDVRFGFDKDAGSVTYKAADGIQRIDAVVDSATPLFDRAKHIDAAIERLPKDVTIGFKPVSGADGATFTTDAKIGMIEAQITDGVTAAPELPEGKTKVVLRKLADEFAIAARLFELRGGKVELIGKQVTAELKLDTLPDGSRQDVDIDVDADIADDAVEAPLDLTAHIEDLPTELDLDLDAAKLDYTASAPITQLVANVRHLPQGAPGQSLAGKPQHIDATINNVPARLEVFLEDIEVKPVGQLGRIDFELWDTGAARPSLPEDERNKLVFDKSNGGLHVQGRLLAGLTHAKLELPKEPAGPTNSRTRVTTGFANDPAPLDVTMDSGTAEAPSHLDVVVNELKRAQQFTVSDYNGLRVDWATNEPGTDVSLDMSGNDIGTDLEISDLPTVAQFCVDGDRNEEGQPPHVQGCVSDIGRSFRVNDRQVTVPTDVAIFAEANGLLRINGWVCLPPTDKEGDRSGNVGDSCVARQATNRLELDELWVQDVALGIYSGETVERKRDNADKPEEDELTKLYLLTDPAGVRVRNLFIRNTVADKRTKIQSGWKEKDGINQPIGDVLRSLHGTAFQLLADVSPIPNTESLKGQIQCDDVKVGVWILLGSFDVVPHIANTFLGPVCD